MERQGQSSRRELQGPRPTPLKVRKDSHKIKKPPVAPPQAGPPPQHPPLPRPPVIIYDVSPKVIHTSPSGFMSLVQRLTGPDPATTSHTSSATSFFTGGVEAISPAARLAMFEKTKMPLEGKSHSCSGAIEGGNQSGFDISDIRPSGGCIQSILSPGPAGLIRPVPPTFFSPVSDPSPLMSLYHQQNSFLHQDYFNVLHQQFRHGGVGGSAGGGAGGGILPSPSAGAFLSPNPMLSPASIEFLTRLLDQ